MTRFRPCIDLHAGQVKQIVGGTLSDKPDELKTNYISAQPAGHFAKLYKEHGLTGGHVVMLGSGNTEATKEAVAAWPGGLQVAGGITDLNAQYWIDAGAEKVWLLPHVLSAYPSSPTRVYAKLLTVRDNSRSL